MIALNEEGRPCLSVGAPLHPPTRSSSPSDAEPESTLTPANIATLMRVGATTTAERMLAPFMAILRESDGDTFAAEVGATACLVCGIVLSDTARLACGSCAN